MSDESELQVPKIARMAVHHIERRPWLSLLGGLALLGCFLPGLRHLSADFSHKAFFFDNDPLLQQFERFERRFGNDDAVVLAVHSPSGVFDVETATLVSEVTEALWKVPEVIRVDSIANYNWVHSTGDDIMVERFFPDDQPLTAELLAERQRIALAHEILPNYLVSKDAKTALLFARVRPGIDKQPDTEVITLAVRELLSKHQRGDHVFHLSGMPVLSYAFKEAAQLDMSRMVPGLMLVVAIILGFLLRSVGGVILPFVVAGLAIVGSLGFAGMLGVQLGNITSMLPNILIACSIADTVHVLVTFYRAMARGMERRAAARLSLLKNFFPTFLTSFTTAMGFFSFISSPLKPLSGLGVMAGAGVLLAWAFSYLVVGALLFVLPLKAGRVAPEESEIGERRASRYVGWILSHKWTVLGVMGGLFVVAGLMALNNTINSDPFKYFAKGYPARTANEFIEEKVGGARGVEIVVDAGSEDGVKEPAFLRKVEAFQKWLESVPRVTRAVSILDILKATHRSLNGDDPASYVIADEREAVSQELFLYTMSLPQGMDLNDRVSLKNDALRITVLWTIPTSAEVVEMVDVIENKAKEMGLAIEVTGKNRLWQSMNGYVVRSFITSFFTAAISISLIIIVALRSLGMGLLAMVPNLVPLVFTGAFLFLLGQPLDVGTVVVASVVLGIAVDDTIHILANFRRALQEGKTREQALVEVFAHTSPALIANTGILCAGFGLFAFATFMPNVYFGVLTALSLVVAAAIDFTLTPVLLAWRARTAGAATGASKAA